MLNSSPNTKTHQTNKQLNKTIPVLNLTPKVTQPKQLNKQAIFLAYKAIKTPPALKRSR